MPISVPVSQSQLPTTPWRTLLKREESYAIHALLDVTNNPGTNAATAAHRYFPYPFLAKVPRRLIKVHYITSTKGRGGGAALRSDPHYVSLLDVIEAMSGPVVLDTCQTQPRCATQQRSGSCRPGRAWQQATLGIREVLGNITLGQLMDRPRP